MADTPAHTHALTMVMESPWEKYGDTSKRWSMKFALSGDDLTDTTAIHDLAAALWGIIEGLVSSQTYWVQFLYYHAGESVNFYQEVYPYGSGSLHGSWEYWAGDPTMGNQLEVCSLAYCLMGNNSKGKAYYLRKFIHDAPQGGSRGTNPGLSEGGLAALQTLNTGFGTSDTIVVDPKTGSAPIGEWNIRPANYTRQLRKSPKGSS